MVSKIKCHNCGGEMRPYRGPKYNKKAGGFLVVAGAATSLFFIGPVLGIPLLIMGLYMSGAKRELWVCQDCQTAIERIELKQTPKQDPKNQENKSEEIEKRVRSLSGV